MCTFAIGLPEDAWWQIKPLVQRRGLFMGKLVAREME
jgi:hypothetical protein